MPGLFFLDERDQDFFCHLEELRKRLLICVAFFVLASAVSFIKGADLIALIKKPAAPFIHEFIFIAPSEGLASYLKVSFLCGFALSFPVMLYEAWAFLGPALEPQKRRRAAIWTGLAVVCFITGIAFSYWIAIPAATGFLIEFGKGVAVPHIALNKYVSFCGALLLSGGLVFEIPVIMVLLADAGLLNPGVLKTKRPYVYLAILVLAAVITPTQDAVNLLVFAIPVAGLYELGLLLSSVVYGAGRKNK